MEPDQKKIIELMYRQELLLGQLYTIFGSQFPEHGTFWGELAKQERVHAQWVKKLYEIEGKDLVTFRPDKINSVGMQTYVTYVEQLIERAKQGDFDLKKAASCTLDMERSLIEKNLIACFQATDPKIDSILLSLTMETKKHIRKAQEFLAKIG